MLFCRVTLGKSFLQFSAMKMAHAPPGHHSVIGRPSVNGLAYAEYVIYRGEQVNKLFQLRHSKVPVKRLKCCLVSCGSGRGWLKKYTRRIWSYFSSICNLESKSWHSVINIFILLLQEISKIPSRIQTNCLFAVVGYKRDYKPEHGFYLRHVC